MIRNKTALPTPTTQPRIAIKRHVGYVEEGNDAEVVVETRRRFNNMNIDRC
jgi:hypothetical protein